MRSVIEYNVRKVAFFAREPGKNYVCEGYLQIGKNRTYYQCRYFETEEEAERYKTLKEAEERREALKEGR